MCTRPSRLITRICLPAAVSNSCAPRPGASDKRRIVQRPDQPRLAHDVGQRLLLVPGVVAQGQAVGAGVEQLARGGLGDAEAGGGVLGVDDDELQAQPPAQARQVLGEARRGPSGRPRLRRKRIASDVLSSDLDDSPFPSGWRPAAGRAARRAPRRPPGRHRRGRGRTTGRSRAQVLPACGRSGPPPCPSRPPWRSKASSGAITRSGSAPRRRRRRRGDAEGVGHQRLACGPRARNISGASRLDRHRQGRLRARLGRGRLQQRAGDRAPRPGRDSRRRR